MLDDVTKARCRRRALAVVVLATSVAAVSCKRTPSELTAVEALHAISSPPGGKRVLGQLDVDRDGHLDGDDWRLFDDIADKASARMRALGIDPSPRAGYYTGPLPDSPSILDLVSVKTGELDIKAVPDQRLRELYVESRWLALQIRLAAEVAPRPPSGATVGGMLEGGVRGYNRDTMEPAAVCAAVAALDEQPYKKAKLPTTAVFDLDSTIWQGNGSDVFLAALIDLGLPRKEANPPLQAFLRTLPGIDAAQVERNSVLANARILLERSANSSLPVDERVSAKDSFLNIVALLTGLKVEDAKAAARRAVEEGALGLPPWKTRVFADRDGCGMAEIIDMLEREDVQVYILSATPDVMVEEAASLLGLPLGHVLGSALEVKDGRYTGSVRDNSYATKDAITRQWLPAPPVFAFGDSPTSDFPMLIEATGAGFMINPRPAFLARDQREAGARLVGLSFDGTQRELAASP